MKVLFIVLLLHATGRSTSSEIKIKSINIRHMRKNDFGLIFGKLQGIEIYFSSCGWLSDAVISNDGLDPKETLSFEIRAGNCCLWIQNELDCDVRRLFQTQFRDFIPIFRRKK